MKKNSFIPKISLYELKNGLKVVFTRIKTPIVALQTWVGAGSGDEVKGKTGLSHFLEHLMFKGTKRYRQGFFDKKIESYGGQTNAATWIDWTYFKEEFPRRFLKYVLQLEVDRYQNIIFEDESFKKELEVVINERFLRVENSPEGKIDELLFEKFFTHHPYGFPTIGYLPDLKGMKIEYVYEHYKKYYVPSNTVLSIAGDVDEDKVLKWIEGFYGKLDSGEKRVRKNFFARKALATEFVEIKEHVANPRLIFAFGSPTYHELKEKLTMGVINLCLASMESSVLNKVLVDELAICSSLGGYNFNFDLSGIYIIEMNLVSEDQMQKVIDLTFEKINSLLSNISENLVFGAKNHIKKNFYKRFKNIGTMANITGEMVLLSGKLNHIYDFIDTLDSISSSDISEVALKYLKNPLIFKVFPENR